MKRVAYLVVAALLALLIQLPAAMAQEDTVLGDDDPYLPEPNAIVVDDAQLQQIAGQQEPPPPAGEPLPATGGLGVGTLLLPAAALLVGLGLLSYVFVLRRQ